MYIGLDFGTANIKACSTFEDGQTGDLRHPARVLSLGGNQLYLPCCIDDTTGEIGWGPYQRRYENEGTVFNYFRDQTHITTEKRPTLGKSQRLIQNTVRGIRTACEQTHDSRESLSAIGWSIPDHWTTDPWALSIAIGKCGFMPSAIVRESMAVLKRVLPGAAHSVNLGEPIDIPPAILLLSMGFGSMRATVCYQQGNSWKTISTARNFQLASGWRLRDALALYWDDQVVVRATRKTARDHPKQNQRLMNAIDAAIVNLISEPSTSVSATLFDEELSLEISRERCAALLETARPTVINMIDELLHNKAVPAARVPIYAWGELASIFPLHHWLDKYTSPSSPVSVLPLDIVAEGTALLTRDIHHQEQDDLLLSILDSSSIADGTLGDSYVPAKVSSSIPVVQSLPCRYGPLSKPLNARLLQLDENHAQVDKRELQNARMVIGRNNNVDWILSGESYDTVSGAHALVLRDGSNFVIRDLNSSNGTFVNSRQVTEDVVLKSGDLISLGKLGPTFRFET